MDNQDHQTKMDESQQQQPSESDMQLQEQQQQPSDPDVSQNTMSDSDPSDQQTSTSDEEALSSTPLEASSPQLLISDVVQPVVPESMDMDVSNDEDKNRLEGEEPSSEQQQQDKSAPSGIDIMVERPARPIGKRKPSKRNLKELLSTVEKEGEESSLSNISVQPIKEAKEDKIEETPKEVEPENKEPEKLQPSSSDQDKMIDEEEKQPLLEKKPSFKEMGVKLPVLGAIPVLRKTSQTQQPSSDQTSESAVPEITDARNMLRKTQPEPQKEPAPSQSPPQQDFRSLLRKVGSQDTQPAAKPQQEKVNQIDFRSVLKKRES